MHVSLDALTEQLACATELMAWYDRPTTGLLMLNIAAEIGSREQDSFPGRLPVRPLQVSGR